MDVVLQAVRQTKRRAILLCDNTAANETRLPEDIFVTDGVPFDWLFSFVSVAVHHGGAGTTAAALRAGIPSVVIPFRDVHPFWGRRVFDLGVGPPPIHVNRLSAARLTDAIHRALNDNEMRRRAAQLGEQIRHEDGVAIAVEELERHVSSLRFDSKHRA
jgi:UDP:flavonoid glycosyltransferase YjiC (YdhE family)